MVKDGIPFVAAPLLFAVVAGYFGVWWIAIPLLALAGFMGYFFRDPNRTIPTEPGIIVSPADGRVTRVERTDDHQLISIFLSPLDVHINRSPISGRIAKIEYIPGKKSPATSDEASLINERNSVYLSGANIDIVCTQIAGIVARRIVCWPAEGEQLEIGERFGLIKFSSRTDVKMPPSATIEVKIGDRVVGGETIIARY